MRTIQVTCFRCGRVERKNSGRPDGIYLLECPACGLETNHRLRAPGEVKVYQWGKAEMKRWKKEMEIVAQQEVPAPTHRADRRARFDDTLTLLMGEEGRRTYSAGLSLFGKLTNRQLAIGNRQ